MTAAGADRGRITVTACGASLQPVVATAKFPGYGVLRWAGTSTPLSLYGPVNRRLRESLLVPELVQLITAERLESGLPARLLLRIPDDLAHDDLRAVPWELCPLGLWVQEGFTGPLVPLTRHPDVQVVRVVRGAAALPGLPSSAAGPVLLAAAYGTNGAIGDESFPALDQDGSSDVAIAEAQLAGTDLPPERVRPGRRRRGVSARDLEEAIDSSRDAVGFYFAGHHGSGGLVVSADESGGDGRPEWLTVDSLAGPLLRAGVQVVVLMACDTAHPSPRRAQQIAGQQSFAELLVLAGIPWVVSAQGAISNGASQAFGPTFLRWLASGADVVEAAHAGSQSMGPATGLVVVHCAARQPAFSVPETTPPTGRILAGLTNASGRETRLVNPDVRWGLNRGPFRAVLAAPADPGLAGRLNRAQEIVRRAAFSVGQRDFRRREWFFVDPARQPLASASDLASLVGPPRLSVSHRDAVADGGSHLGFVVTWDPRSGADVRGHLTALWTCLPRAATVACVTGSAHEQEARRLRAGLARTHLAGVDLLIAADGALDDLLDEQIDQDPAALTGTAAQGIADADPDAVALAALRNVRQVGWREAGTLLRQGVSTEVRLVARYLEARDPAGSADLTFMCEAEPPVVDAAWRAGIRPEFTPSGLPPGAARMRGCWALLARSRLTPDMARWLYQRGPPLAGVTGLIPEAEPDHGYDDSLAQIRGAYGVLSLRRTAAAAGWRSSRCSAIGTSVTLCSFRSSKPSRTCRRSPRFATAWWTRRSRRMTSSRTTLTRSPRRARGGSCTLSGRSWPSGRHARHGRLPGPPPNSARDCWSRAWVRTL